MSDNSLFSNTLCALAVCDFLLLCLWVIMCTFLHSFHTFTPKCFSFTLFWIDIDVLCFCEGRGIFVYLQVCVLELYEYIALHESKQQVALTFSKEHACSYFDIDSCHTFTVKFVCLHSGRACWIRSIPPPEKKKISLRTLGLLLVLWTDTEP